jgi:hypothetical protein
VLFDLFAEPNTFRERPFWCAWVIRSSEMSLWKYSLCHGRN